MRRPSRYCQAMEPGEGEREGAMCILRLKSVSLSFYSILKKTCFLLLFFVGRRIVFQPSERESSCNSILMYFMKLIKIMCTTDECCCCCFYHTLVLCKVIL